MTRDTTMVKTKKVPKTTNDEATDAVKKVRIIRRKELEPEINIDDTPSEVTVTPGGTRQRREVTPETVDVEFSTLTAFIDAEISRQRDMKEHSGSRVGTSSLKFLRSVLKRTKQLQSDVRRIARKRRAPRQGTNNSGFMKEARVSDELADFLDVEHGTYMPRTECTKLLHKYIMAHNLQNPDNRREIFADKDLTNLLRYNKKPIDQGGHGPLYYYVIQQLIQQHFTK